MVRRSVDGCNGCAADAKVVLQGRLGVGDLDHHPVYSLGHRARLAHLPGSRLLAQLGDELVALGESRGPDGVPLPLQPPARVHHPLPAQPTTASPQQHQDQKRGPLLEESPALLVGDPGAVAEEFEGGRGGVGEAEGAVHGELVAGEAVVELHHVHVRHAPPCLTSSERHFLWFDGFIHLQ